MKLILSFSLNFLMNKKRKDEFIIINNIRLCALFFILIFNI
jgi:hypothetical protein